jgi:signal transduction histidine kinase
VASHSFAFVEPPDDADSATVAELREELGALRVEFASIKDELARANRARTDFLANVSHELRTPLTAILGFTELLAEGIDGPLNPRQHEDAATILASSRRLLELVDDLIDLSQVDADRVELRLQPVDIAPLLAAAVDDARSGAGEKGLLLVGDPPAGSLVAKADATRVATILNNLIDNAVKFTPPRGEIRTSGWLEPAQDERASFVRVDVADSGVGIATTDQERVFEKFQRLGGPAQPGAGLGLTIARELARMHGGSLTVETTLGLGSRFTLRLPAAEPPLER